MNTVGESQVLLILTSFLSCKNLNLKLLFPFPLTAQLCYRFEWGEGGQSRCVVGLKRGEIWVLVIKLRMLLSLPI